MDLARVREDGSLDVYFHPGQLRAYESTRRIIAVLAGTQSGKTSFAPHWLHQEMRRCGPGDYMFVTPTYPLLELKALPEFLRLFERSLQLGYYLSSPRRVFHVTEEGAQRLFENRFPEKQVETRVIFGYASDPDSLESATALAAVLDEAGQKKFRVGSWEAVLRRLSLSQGRVLITTSVYAMNWLKTRVFGPYQAGDDSIDVIQFDSRMNPGFPHDEFERARRDLPRWKFEQMYCGRFTRPAGLIYDCFDRERHTCPRFTIPRAWRRYVGLDFGSRNMAAVFLAAEPETRRLYIYRTYHRGGLSAAGHTKELQRGEPGLPRIAVGGARSEEEWRREFAGAGYPVRRPDISDVELGIDRVYGALQRAELVFFDDLGELLEEVETYSRVLDEEGNPQEQIEDKETYHLLDSLRYVVAKARPLAPPKVRRAHVDFYDTRPWVKKKPLTVLTRSAEEIESMLNQAPIFTSS